MSEAFLRVLVRAGVMRKSGQLFLALMAMLCGTAPASAGTFEWGTTVEGRIGYGTNPFLNFDNNKGSGLVGFTIAPTVRWREATSSTDLSGSYNRDQYFTRYRHADDFNVDLRHTQHLSDKLSANADVGYFSSISGLSSSFYNRVVIDPGVVDQLAIGTRQRRVYGDAGLNWQPTSRDSFQLSGIAERNTFSRFGGDYSYLGLTGGYLRTIDARTRVGFNVSVGRTYSHDFPNSSTIQPSLVVQRTLDAHWTFNGGVGIIVQREKDIGGSRTTVTPGFDVSLCSTYPRLSLCVTGSRQAAASGLGGLRRQTQIGANATYRLTEHRRIVGVASYGISQADRTVLIDNITYGNQRYALGRVDVQQDVSRRVTAGVSGSYQRRTGSGLPEVHALAITFNLTAKFGHLS